MIARESAVGVTMASTEEKRVIEGETVEFRLIGNFTAAGSSGADLTPRGAKARGLLALLLFASEYSRPRVFLQDKLWSDRGTEQGAASLRQTLTEIRKALGPARDILVTDNRRVALDARRVSRDIDNPDSVDFLAESLEDPPELMEDLDVRDAEFEAWIRNRRAEFADLIAGRRQKPAVRNQAANASGRCTVALVSSAEGTGGLSTMDMMTGAIGQSLSELGCFDVVQIRPTHGNPDPASDRSYDLVVRGREDAGAMTRRYRISIDAPRLRRPLMRSQRVVESCADYSAEQIETLALTNQSIDCAIGAVTSETVRPDGAAGSALDGLIAVERMFRERGPATATVRAVLQRCHEADGRGIHLAWQAFLFTYAVGDRDVRDLDQTREEARALIRRALELEPNNSLVVALASYVHGFVLGEYPVAFELASRSVTLNRANCLGWAFLGAACLYVGRYEDGHRCAAFARAISGLGTYHYLVDMICCMASTLTNRLDEATHIGAATHCLAPGYSPPLRYLAAIYSKRRDQPSLRTAMKKLKALEPDFSLELMLDRSYPIPALRQAKFFSEPFTC